MKFYIDELLASARDMRLNSPEARSCSRMCGMPPYKIPYGDLHETAICMRSRGRIVTPQSHELRRIHVCRHQDMIPQLCEAEIQELW
jgi:hypothetical protein